MGEHTDSRGVRSFTPDDTETAFYLRSNYESVSLGYILELARGKWGDSINIDLIDIESEYIHTDYFFMGDYTRYLRIEYNPET